MNDPDEHTLDEAWGEDDGPGVDAVEENETRPTMGADVLRRAAAEVREDIRLGIVSGEELPLYERLADLFEATVREHFDVDCGEDCTTRTYPIEALAAAYLSEVSS